MYYLSFMRAVGMHHGMVASAGRVRDGGKVVSSRQAAWERTACKNHAMSAHAESWRGGGGLQKRKTVRRGGGKGAWERAEWGHRHLHLQLLAHAAPCKRRTGSAWRRFTVAGPLKTMSYPYPQPSLRNCIHRSRMPISLIPRIDFSPCKDAVNKQ